MIYPSFDQLPWFFSVRVGPQKTQKFDVESQLQFRNSSKMLKTSSAKANLTTMHSLKQLLQRQAALLQSQPSKTPANVVAFDADGTLWPQDIGESFFQFQIRNRLLPKLPAHAWELYRNWKSTGHPHGAYLWLAQINSGLPIDVVRTWAADHFASLGPNPFFAQSKELVHEALRLGFRVQIVTASVSWAIEPGARALGLTNESVLGVCTALQNHRVGLLPGGIITYKEGKLQRLQAHNPNSRLFLACGNSEGDQQLLLGAQHGLAIRSAGASHELAKTEQALFELARSKGWFRLDLRLD